MRLRLDSDGDRPVRLDPAGPDGPVAYVHRCDRPACGVCERWSPARVTAELATLLMVTDVSAEPDEDHLRTLVDGVECAWLESHYLTATAPDHTTRAATRLADAETEVLPALTPPALAAMEAAHRRARAALVDCPTLVLPAPPAGERTLVRAQRWPAWLTPLALLAGSVLLAGYLIGATPTGYAANLPAPQEQLPDVPDSPAAPAPTGASSAGSVLGTQPTTRPRHRREPPPRTAVPSAAPTSPRPTRSSRSAGVSATPQPGVPSQPGPSPTPKVPQPAPSSTAPPPSPSASPTGLGDCVPTCP